jgi:hypothetical protein
MKKAVSPSQLAAIKAMGGEELFDPSIPQPRRYSAPQDQPVVGLCFVSDAGAVAPAFYRPFIAHFV